MQCNKIALEMARRQTDVDGYHFWTIFRGARRNYGIVDDFAMHPDIEPLRLRQSNGSTALLIDRDFNGRTWVAGQRVELDIYLSHFGSEDVKGGLLRWNLIQNTRSFLQGKINRLSFGRGKNGKICRIRFIVPELTKPSQVKFKVKLNWATKRAVTNSWDFWIFPSLPSAIPEKNIAITGSPEFQKEWLALIPDADRLEDLKATYQGIREPDLATFMKKFRPHLVISDRLDSILERFVKSGGHVLLLGRGQLPDDWFAHDPDRADVYTFFAPFRTGWDHGNAATIIEIHPAIGNFPHRGFCDLQFFELIQGAHPFIIKAFPGKVKPIIRNIPLMRKADVGLGEKGIFAPMQTESRAYLLESFMGKGKILGCSLNLNCYPAGRYLLRGIIKYMLRGSNS